MPDWCLDPLQGQVVYEWDQTLEEVNIYVALPPGVRAKDLFCDITSSHVRFGLNANPPYLDVRPSTLRLALHPRSKFM